MFRRVGLGAAAVCAAGLIAAGCSSDGDTIVGGGTFTTDNFPGSAVSVNDVADDLRALTPNNHAVTNGGFYWNTDGHAIMLIGATEAGNTHLFAAYYNGSAFSRPVELRGENQANGAISGAKVLWLKTGNARNGDAIIAFTRDDEAPIVVNGATGDPVDSNRRLYATYFDRSAAGAAATGTWQGGFQTLAIAVDHDLKNDTTGGNDTDNDIGTFGFVSDSLRGTHDFSGGWEDTFSGDTTTQAHILFEEDQTSGSTAAGTRYVPVYIDLTNANAADNALSTVFTTGNALAAATGISLATTDSVDTSLTVSDNFAFWAATELNATDGTDTAVTVTRLSATGAAAASTLFLGSAAVATSTDTTNLPAASHVYGADHGLDHLYVFFTESGFNQDGTDGKRASDLDLMFAKISTGTTPAVDGPVEIDAWKDTILLDDGAGDADAFHPRNGVQGKLVSFQTAINRNSSAIAVLMLQDSTNVLDPDDAVQHSGANLFNTALFATVCETGSTRAANVSCATTARAGSLVPSGTFPTAGTDGRQDQDNVSSPQFQLTLAQGQTHVQAGTNAEPACAFQANPLRFNFTYLQGGDWSAVATAEDQNLFLNHLIMTAGVDVNTAPVMTLGNDTTGASIASVDVGTADSVATWTGFANVKSIDAGYRTSTANTFGAVLTFFTCQDLGNSPTAADGTGAYSEVRLQVSDNGGTPDMVSTDGALNNNQYNGGLQVVAVPASTSVAGNGGHSPSTIHVLWTENYDNNGSAQRLGARSYDATKTAATGATLATNFTPVLTAGPNFVDNPSDAAIGMVKTLTSGSTVGVYFTEGNHFFYQETSGTADSYTKENGMAAPQLVDNESSENSANEDVVQAPNCGGLSGSLAFFTKTDIDGDVRYHVRRRN